MGTLFRGAAMPVTGRLVLFEWEVPRIECLRFIWLNGAGPRSQHNRPTALWLPRPPL